MSHTDEQLTRLFDRAFADEAPDDDLWEATRRSMRRKVRTRRVMLLASAALVAALAIPVPQMLLSERGGSDVEFADTPAEADRPPRDPAPESDDDAAPDTPPPADERDPDPSAPGPAPEPEPDGEPRSDAAAEDDTPRDSQSEGGADASAGFETTEWYTVNLSEEIDAGARYFSAWKAMDALVANMRFGDGAEVSHGVSEATESSARGWIRTTGLRDDSVAGEEFRVQIGRDQQGWFINPVGEARASCARGADQTDRSRCL